MADNKALLFYVNGKRIEVFDADPEETLLYYLRERLRLCGTKAACGEGGCGACTVMLSHFRNGKIVHRAINACITPIPYVHFSAVTTIEGIGSTKTKLNKIQQVLIDNHGVQCGFCTPGIVMSMYALLRNHPKPTEETIKEALQGNLCRCTGYRPIIQGFKLFAAAEKEQEIGKGNFACALGEKCCKNQKSVDEKQIEINKDFVPSDPTQEPIFPPELKSVEYESTLKIEGPKVTWYRPKNLEAMLKIRNENPEARIISGGTVCTLESKFDGIVNSKLISVATLSELSAISATKESVCFGAATTLTEISDFIKNFLNEKGESRKFQVLEAILETSKWFAGKQVRNMATIGANLMCGNSFSDLPPILMAAGAKAKFARLNEGRGSKR